MTNKKRNNIIAFCIRSWVVAAGVCVLGMVWGPDDYWYKGLVTVTVIYGVLIILLPCTDELED